MLLRYLKSVISFSGKVTRVIDRRVKLQHVSLLRFCPTCWHKWKHQLTFRVGLAAFEMQGVFWSGPALEGKNSLLLKQICFLNNYVGFAFCHIVCFSSHKRFWLHFCPFLKMRRANTPVSEVPARIPGAVPGAVLPPAACAQGVVTICIFKHHMHF